MKTRIISACVLIVLVLACFLLSPVSRALLILAAAVLAVWEMTRAVGNKDIVCTPWVLYVYVFAASALIYFRLDPLYSEALFFFAVFVILTCGVTMRRIRAPGALASLAVLVYPVVPLLIILDLSLGENWVPVFAIGCISTWICDSFALFGGKLFGKNKLCPEVSPNKTIEGTVSGAVAAMIFAVPLYFALRAGYGVSLVRCILTALICSSFGQVGDLAASLIKRAVGIKDYSNLIPGHGGIMDRIDSLLFSIPTAYFCLSMI